MVLTTYRIRFDNEFGLCLYWKQRPDRWRRILHLYVRIPFVWGMKKPENGPLWEAMDHQWDYKAENDTENATD